MKFSSKKYFNFIAELSNKISDLPEYQKTIDILLDCYRKGGVVFTMGCGGSASTATHFASDLAKTHGGFKAVSLVDNIPLVSAYTNDDGWNSIFSGQLKNWITENDVLIGFSVHGGRKDWSSNLIDAMKLAKKNKAKIISFAGFDGGAMKDLSDVCLIVPTSDETYGTPLIESLHVVIHHGLIFDLKERTK